MKFLLWTQWLFVLSAMALAGLMLFPFLAMQLGADGQAMKWPVIFLGSWALLATLLFGLAYIGAYLSQSAKNRSNGRG